MHSDRFFQTTRGKIVSEATPARLRLGRRSGAAPSGSRRTRFASNSRSSNATAGRGNAGAARTDQTDVRVSLTPEADGYFRRRYDKMLSAVLREVRDQFGTPAGGADLRRFIEAGGGARSPSVTAVAPKRKWRN